jgi:hypothetical protein
MVSGLHTLLGWRDFRSRGNPIHREEKMASKKVKKVRRPKASLKKIPLKPVATLSRTGFKDWIS